MPTKSRIVLKPPSISQVTVGDLSVPAALPKSDKYGVAARWSKNLARTGFVPVVQDFLEHYHALKPYQLTHSEAMFVIHLIRYKWDASAPYPGYKTIAGQMGVSTKSARRYALSLEQKGYLIRQQRKGETNRFEIAGLINALERHVEEVESRKKTQGKRRTTHI